MKKLIITICLLSLSTACSSTPEWKPLTDPRASKEPREIIRDTLECERLTKNLKYKPSKFLGVPYFWGSSAEHERKLNTNPLSKCLSGRGHSILN